MTDANVTSVIMFVFSVFPRKKQKFSLSKNNLLLCRMT